MGIGKRILNVLIGLLFIISVTVLGSSFLAKKVLVDAISQAGVDTAISHRMMRNGSQRYRTRSRKTEKYRQLHKRS